MTIINIIIINISTSITVNLNRNIINIIHLNITFRSFHFFNNFFIIKSDQLIFNYI